MTQAFNLSQFANNVNSSGLASLTTGVTGTLPVANGGTGTTTPSLVAGSGISITGSFPNQTVAASGSGTVTSVATGNGLSGGTITSTGTLVIACPTFNTVGSYCFALTQGTTLNPGSNYAANSQIQCYSVDPANTQANTSSISGTWKWMAATTYSNGTGMMGIACRVS
jgi:hypothetical protein